MAYHQYPQYQPPMPPPGPHPPPRRSNRGPVVAAVAAGAVLLLLLTGAVVIVVLSRTALPATSEPAGAQYDGVWAGHLTQYDDDDNEHGLWEVEFALVDGDVTSAEETSDDFGYDQCVWEPRDVAWFDEELSFHYTVSSREPSDGTCAPTGDVTARVRSDTVMEVTVTSPGLPGYSEGFVFLRD